MNDDERRAGDGGTRARHTRRKGGLDGDWNGDEDEDEGKGEEKNLSGERGSMAGRKKLVVVVVVVLNLLSWSWSGAQWRGT